MAIRVYEDKIRSDNFIQYVECGRTFLMTNSPSKINKFDDLYGYWTKVPLIEEVDEYTFREIARQPFRDAILWILRTGIIEENKRRRYVLSAPEMLPFIRTKLKNKVSLTNVYFHLEKLVKHNLIKKILTQKEGKTFVTYYGRTSKLIIFAQSKILDNEHKASTYDFDDLLKIVNELGYSIDVNRISDLLDAIYNRNLELYQLEKQWMENNQDILINNDINIYQLYNYFKNRLRLGDPGLKDLYTRLYEEVGLDLYKRGKI